MPKSSQIDKAIANLQAKIDVLLAALVELRAVQIAKPAKVSKAKPKPRPVEDVGRAS